MKSPFLRIATLAMIVLVATGIEALPNLERVIASQLEEVAERPTDPAVHNDLGNLLVLAERLDEAERAYRRAKELSPSDESARFNLGLLLHQQQRLDEAYDELSQLIEMQPQHAWAHYQLGVLEFERGRRSEALTYYAKSFALDPTLTFDRNNPHIIDNELATEALLRSSQYLSSAASTMPRSYGEGARLRELMLAQQEQEIAAEVEAEMEMEESWDGEKESREESTESSTESSRGGAANDPDSDSGSYDRGGELSEREPLPRSQGREDIRRRVDREDEEDAGSARSGVVTGVAVGQPVQPVGRDEQPEARSGSRQTIEAAPSAGSAARREAIRERLRGRQTTEETPRSVTGRSVTTPQQPADPPAAAPRYRPSRRSSASLDLEILDQPIRDQPIRDQTIRDEREPVTGP